MATGFDRRQPTRETFAFQPSAPIQEQARASGQSRGAQIVGGESHGGVVAAGPQTNPGNVAAGLGAFVEQAMQPHIQRRQQEEFFKGFTKAQSGMTMDEIAEGNSPLKRIFGPSDYEQGAAFFTASAKVSEHAAEMLRDRDTLKRMRPEELSKVLGDRANKLLTGNAAADALIMQQVMQSTAPVMATIAKEREAWQQQEAASAWTGNGSGKADAFQAITAAQADLNDPDENDNTALRQAATDLIGAVMVKPEGMADETYRASVFQLMRSSAQRGNLAAVKAMKAAGALSLFPEEDRVKLEDAVHRYTERTYEDFAASDETFIALAREYRVQEGRVKIGAPAAWSADQFANHRRRMNAYVRAKTGGDEDLFDFAKIDSEGASLTGAAAEAFNRAQARKWQLEDRKYARDTAVMQDEAEEAAADRRAGVAWGTGDVTGYAAAGGDGNRINARALAEFRQGNLAGIVRAFRTSHYVSDAVKADVQAGVEGSLDEQYGKPLEAAHKQWKALYDANPGLTMSLYGDYHDKMLSFDSLVGQVGPQAAYLRAFGNTARYADTPPLSKDAAAALDGAIANMQPSWLGRMFGATRFDAAAVQVIKNIAGRRLARSMKNSNVTPDVLAPGALSASMASGELQIAGGKPWAAAAGTPTFARRIGLQQDEADEVFTLLLNKRLKDVGFKAGTAGNLDIDEIHTPKGNEALHIVARDTEGESRSIIVGIPDFKAAARNLTQLRVEVKNPAVTISDSVKLYHRQQRGKGIPVATGR